METSLIIFGFFAKLHQNIFLEKFLGVIFCYLVDFLAVSVCKSGVALRICNVNREWHFGFAWFFEGESGGWGESVGGAL